MMNIQYVLCTAFIKKIKDVLNHKKSYPLFNFIDVMSSAREKLVLWSGLSYRWIFQLCRPWSKKQTELSFIVSTLGGDKRLVWSDGETVSSLCLPLMKLTLRFLNSVKLLQTIWNIRTKLFFFFLSCQVSWAWPEASAPRLRVPEQQAPWASHQPDHRQTQTHQPGELSACVALCLCHLSFCSCELLCLLQ